MSRDSINNIRIESEEVLITPQMLKEAVPASPEVETYINQARQTIANILLKKDHRLLVIAGPCSIHDIEAAKEYAQKLKALHDKHADSLYIVMRCYFEKPRTTVGWKGLINDPHLDGSFDIEEGLKHARALLTWITELNLPIATEALDPISPQYLSDLMSWAAIGARTTESQTHREMASGLSMPVGFKNGTDGNLATALNAMQAASQPHAFMGINQEGQVSLLKTAGNPHGHVILRGGKQPNYDSVHVSLTEQSLEKAGQPARIMIDCSHANSNKQHELQPLVAQNVARQIQNGNTSIIGIMLESHLFDGNQKLNGNLDTLRYGVSITDACIDWETTEKLCDQLAADLAEPLRQRQGEN